MMVKNVGGRSRYRRKYDAYRMPRGDGTAFSTGARVIAVSRSADCRRRRLLSSMMVLTDMRFLDVSPVSAISTRRCQYYVGVNYDCSSPREVELSAAPTGARSAAAGAPQPRRRRSSVSLKARAYRA